MLAWGATAYARFGELAADASTGVRIREGIEVARRNLADPWWADAVGGVDRCAPPELPDGFADGIRFRVPIVAMPRYLRWLTSQVEAGGGSIERHRVTSLTEAAGNAQAVVNCAGLGARDLASDTSVVPVRGQVLRLHDPGLDRFLLHHDDSDVVTYVVPRGDDVVCGGTADEDRWDTTPDPDVARGILARCVELEPRLEGCEVLGHAVGLRPARPTVRVEQEEVDGVTVVHDYGHGGAGVTLSWGCAEEVAALLVGA